MVAAGEDQDVGPYAKVLQGARQFAARLGDADRELPGTGIVAAVDRAGEGCRTVEGSYDVRMSDGRAEARRVDPETGEFGLEPVDRGIVMSAVGMAGRVDDERLHGRSFTARQAGR